MRPRKIVGHLLIFGVIGLGVYQYFADGSQEGADYPRKPIRIVVPFQPGGGSDTFVRIIQKAIKDSDLMPYPLVVVNKPGGGTSIGTSYVSNARPDGYTALCLHDAMMVAKTTGQSLRGPDDFEAVAATGEFEEVILVSDNSPYPSLPALMAATKANPETVKFGVSLSTPAHFSAIMLEKALPGARFRFVATGGGANRLTGLMGGHLDVIILSVGEYLRFEQNGLKAIALLGKERMKVIPDVPTGEELGFPIFSGNFHQWWFPKGTDQRAVDYLADVLRRAMQTDYVLQRTSELQVDPKIIVGEPLKARIAAQMDIFGRIKPVNRVRLPNFANWAIGSVVVFALIVFGQWMREKRLTGSEAREPGLRRDLAFGVFGMTILYVLLMGLGVLSFVWATMAFVTVAGLCLTRGEKRHLIYVAETAFVLSFGLHFVFVQIFTIDLP